MQDKAATIAEFLKKQSFVHVVTHIDADGLASGAIASMALDRAAIPHEVEFIKQLDQQKVKELQQGGQVLWFTDLGSGKISDFDPLRTIITDHHIPQNGSEVSSPEIVIARPSQGQTNLLDFSSSPTQPIPIPSHALGDEPFHLNPHLFGYSGATDISGAGVTYLVARALDSSNTDLASLAIVGAVGDLQDVANCKLIGLNRDILEEGMDRGVVGVENDLRYFGRETRPIHKLLQYSSDPIVPTLSGSEGGSLEFLMEKGIELKSGDDFRCWVDLESHEKRTIISGMVRLALTLGLGPEDVRRMIGEVYSLPGEEKGTPLHDAKEFATMLNACGKNLNPEIGFQVCKGDRGEFLERAYGLLRGHRRNLASLIQLIEQDIGIEQREVIQFFDGGKDIPENLVGIVAGMVLNSGGSDLSKVMVGLAKAENGYKISARTTRGMIQKGINLAEALKSSSQQVGGEGGGHNIAAGAFIPEHRVKEFLGIFENILKDQLSE